MKKTFVLDILFDNFDMEYVNNDIDSFEFSEWLADIKERYGVKVWTHENRLFVSKENEMPMFKLDSYGNLTLTLGDTNNDIWSVNVAPKEIKVNII